MAAFVADKQLALARQHWFEVIAQHAVWTANDLVSHFEPSALSPSALALLPQPCWP